MSSGAARRPLLVEKIASSDGTPIAYQRTGSGPALVLVVGAFCDRMTTATLTPLLAPHFTVYEYDRRGRGDSGHGGAYAVEREIEDLAAVVSAAGGQAFAYGHSSGAILALEAAAVGVPLTRLALYEPPYTAPAGSDGSDELLDAIRERLDADDRDGAAAAFMRGSGAPAEAVEEARQSPWWPRMRALAPTLVHDLTLSNRGLVPGERLERVPVPVLAVSGGASPEWAARACEGVAAVVRDGRTAVLEGQPHGAAHDAVAPVLIEWFLSRPEVS
jgi:pimeloyl-ACP methyl ester carboxylesterase